MAGHITEHVLVLCDGYLTNNLLPFSSRWFRRVYNDAISSKEMILEYWDLLKRLFFLQYFLLPGVSLLQMTDLVFPYLFDPPWFPFPWRFFPFYLPFTFDVAFFGVLVLRFLVLGSAGWLDLLLFFWFPASLGCIIGGFEWFAFPSLAWRLLPVIFL